MKQLPSSARRRGSIIPLLAICVVALFAFIALAVDLGVLMVARTECQNAADTAALTGARTLDNRPVPTAGYYNNRSQAEVNARKAVTNNVNLNKAFKDNSATDTDIESFRIGMFDYDPLAGRFYVSYPNVRPTGKSWGAAEVIVRIQQETFFARALGVSSMPVAARAVAVHRPRDIALVLDFSGSMKNGSKFNWGNDQNSSGMINPDDLYPKFGHYARYETGYRKDNPNVDPWSWGAADRPHPLTQNSGYYSNGNFFAPNNYTIPTSNGPAMVKNFYYDPANLSNPSTPATPITVTGSVPNLRRGFHQWEPGISNAGNPSAYVGPTYNFAGYNAFDTSGSYGAVPAPKNFETQSDSPVTYVGDKWPRKFGVESNDPWDATNVNGAAVNLAEYLGWTDKYTGSNSLPNFNEPPNVKSWEYNAGNRLFRTNSTTSDQNSSYQAQYPGSTLSWPLDFHRIASSVVTTGTNTNVPTATPYYNYLRTRPQDAGIPSQFRKWNGSRRNNPYGRADSPVQTAPSGQRALASLPWPADVPQTVTFSSDPAKTVKNYVRPYKTDWSDFRDATWEKYGYDLNVAHYVNNRGNHDPRRVYANAQFTNGKFKG
ncbi:MAG: pilus assembly protein TadG-related protein, partial [Gemmataceae bacterium]